MKRIKDPRVMEMVEKYRILNQGLKAIERNSAFDRDALNMCLVSGLVIPPKFKVLDFQKYKGDNYSKHHLVMFYRKMTSYTLNDKLMIHYFENSLSGASLEWYMQLKQSHIHT